MGCLLLLVSAGAILGFSENRHDAMDSWLVKSSQVGNTTEDIRVSQVGREEGREKEVRQEDGWGEGGKAKLVACLPPRAVMDLTRFRQQLRLQLVLGRCCWEG